MAVRSGTLTTSTTAARLSADQRAGRVWVKNNDATIVIFIGGSASQDYGLAAGASLGPLDVENLNEIYAKSASGTPVLQWFAN